MTEKLFERPLLGNPFAGKDDVAAAVRALTAPPLRHLSHGGARLRLSSQSVRYSEAASEMEGMARLLWGLAPLAAGAGDAPGLERLLEGVAHGCDPDHPEFWDPVVDSDQRMVEMAAIGLTFALLKERAWGRYSARQRERIAAWLHQINVREPNQNNWQFFRVMVNLGLAAVGERADAAANARAFAKIDGWHLQNGWYVDGKPGQRDHYVPFAFHFYGLIYAALAGEVDPARAALFKERAAAFAPTYAATFAPDGAGLPFGRSLTYRTALAGFFGALAFANVEALPWGVLKGLYLRHWRWWADKPIADRDGVLSIGFAYPNMMLSEQYNSPGSPYWALKAALPLALPATHPFWSAAEVAPDASARTVAAPDGGMLIQRAAGHVVALVAGQENMTHRGGVEKYGKFAYSTHFGFSVETMGTVDALAADSMLMLSDDGVHPRVREKHVAWRVSETEVWSRWTPWSDVTVDSWLAPAGAWQIRIHRVVTPRPLQTLDAGFSVPVGDDEAPADLWNKRTIDAEAFVKVRGGFCGLFDPVGSRPAKLTVALPGTNLIWRRTVIPKLAADLPAGESWLAMAVLATPDPEEGARLWASPPNVAAALARLKRENA
jgi:hypothetical protein